MRWYEILWLKLRIWLGLVEFYDYEPPPLCAECNGYGWLPGGPEGTVCTGLCEACDCSGLAPSREVIA